MKKRLVVIQRKYSDGDLPSRCIIGAVITSRTEREINHLWQKWQEEVKYPDSDSQFIDWLVEEQGFQRAEGWDEVTIAD